MNTNCHSFLEAIEILSTCYSFDQTKLRWDGDKKEGAHHNFWSVYHYVYHYSFYGMVMYFLLSVYCSSEFCVSMTYFLLSIIVAHNSFCRYLSLMTCMLMWCDLWLRRQEYCSTSRTSSYIWLKNVNAHVT